MEMTIVPNSGKTEVERAELGSKAQAFVAKHGADGVKKEALWNHLFGDYHRPERSLKLQIAVRARLVNKSGDEQSYVVKLDRTVRRKSKKRSQTKKALMPARSGGQVTEVSLTEGKLTLRDVTFVEVVIEKGNALIRFMLSAFT